MKKNSLVQTVRIFGEDIGMEFGIQKCPMVELIRGHIVESSSIALPNGAEIRSLKQSEGYKNFGIFQRDDTRNKEIKQIIKKECFMRVRNVLKASLNGKNTIESINSWGAFATVRCSAGIVNWTKEGLREMDRKTRTLLTVYRCIHSQAVVGRLYWKGKGDGGLIDIKDFVTLEENILGYYINRKQEKLPQDICTENIIR